MDPNQFDEYYGKYSKSASRKTNSPRIGLSWPEEAPRKTVPFIMRDSMKTASPSERRRLVSELRSEVRRVAYRSSPSQRSPPFSDFNGGDIRGSPNFLSEGGMDFPDKRMDSFDFLPKTEETYQHSTKSMHNGRKLTTEEEAAKELAELDRSTENLRKLGVDLMQFASEYAGRTRFERAAMGSPDTSFSSSPTRSASFIQAQTPSLGSFQQVNYSSAPTYFTMSPQQQQQYFQPQLINPQPPSSSNGGGPMTPNQQQQQQAYYGAPPIYIIPQPPIYFAPPPTQQHSNQGSFAVPPQQMYSVHPSSNQQKPEESKVSTSEETKETKKEEPLARKASMEYQKPPSETEKIQMPVSPITQVAIPHSELNEEISVKEKDHISNIPPAHVDLSSLEDERARRKKEFLARRQKSMNNGDTIMASIAEDAATMMQHKHSDKVVTILESPTKEDETVPLESQKYASAIKQPPRHVVILTPEQELNRSLSAPIVPTETSGEEELTESEQDRAIRFARLAEEAQNLDEEPSKVIEQVEINSMAVIPFGVFLRKAKMTGNGSYDNADLASSFKVSRPPPVLPGQPVLSGRRRARSDERLTDPRCVPQSVIKSMSERKPIDLGGYFLKSSGPKRFTQTNGSWQRRWFILSGRLLLYTSSETSTTVKRMISLENIDIITDPALLPSGTPTPHCIGIVEIGEPRMLTICAENHATILKWYKGLVLNVALLCENKVSAAMPPVNRTKSDQTVEWRKQMEQRHNENLPKPPDPEISWFYPIWEKPKSYYDLLELSPDATSSMIKKSYYRIAKGSHPDSRRNLKVEEVTESKEQQDFAAIALAYETLIDPEKRSAYDLAERIKEELRLGIEIEFLQCLWTNEDLKLEPRLRIAKNVRRKRVTLFCDGELRCLYWQDAPEAGAALLPLQPNPKKCIEMRFVQQILYLRDGPVDFGDHVPIEYEEENRFCVLGDRLHTGVLIFQAENHLRCSEIVHGLRVARCEKSMLFQQKLDQLKEQGIQ